MLLSELIKKVNHRLKSSSACVWVNQGQIRADSDKSDHDPYLRGICTDHNKIKGGELFVAIKGLRADGHMFAEEAVRRGAVAVLISKDELDRFKESFEKTPIICVENTRKACAYVYSAFLGDPQDKMKIVGITGTNGKTTVANLIFHILNWAGIPCGIIGTLGAYTSDGVIDIRSSNPEANMTTPDPEELYAILDEMQKRGSRVAVMEVTSHSLVFEKTAPVDFDIGVFTNLTEDHLDLHKNMENYFAAKASLFERCGRAVINYDDIYGRRLSDMISRKIPANLCSKGIYPTDTVAEDIRYHGESGIDYKLVSPRFRLRVKSSLPGEFNVMNSMQAVMVAHHLGIGISDIMDALAHYRGVDGRLERLKIDGKCNFSVYIDYAHTPDALENLLRTVRAFAGNERRIVLLFGCGGERDRQKRPVMGKIATEMADYTVITSDNSRSEKSVDIINDILSGVSDEGCFTVIGNRSKAIEHIIKTAASGDIILLAGKGHECYEIGESGKTAFSEKALVREFIKKYW